MRHLMPLYNVAQANIMFAKQKNKVLLATQLQSISAIDALNFYENKLKIKKIKSAEGTITYIKTSYDIFDILNSQSIRPTGWKKAICRENIGLVAVFFDSPIENLIKIKVTDGTTSYRFEKKNWIS